VSVGDDELDTGQPAGLERAQEGGPERAVLAVTHIQAQDLPAAVGGDPGGDHHRPRHHPAVHPRLDIGGVQEHIREGDMGQRPAAEGGHLGVQLPTDAGDLRLGDPGVHAQGADQVIDLAGGGAVHLGVC
jgi:hypothetical protein